MTPEEKVKRELDALRSEINSLRNQVDGQNKAIQAIASKVAELRGMIETVARGRRL